MNQHDDEPRRSSGGYVPFMPGQAKAAPNRAARRARKQHLDRLHRRADRAGARVFKAALSSGRLGELSQDAQEDDDDR